MSEENKNVLINMPNEILKLIFSYITDTNTYKNTRLVCRLFQDILIDVKIFNQNNLYLNFRINRYYNNNNNEEITIMDQTKAKIGYIKIEYPMCVIYYINIDNTSIEYKMNPNEVITKETMKNNNIIKTNIIIQNLKTKSSKKSTLTKIFPNNVVHNHPYIPPNIPPNGCNIC